MSEHRPSRLTLPRHPVRAIIFDLGDVMFTWSAPTTTNISERTLRNILKSTVWKEFERGNIDQAECYKQAADQYNVSAIDINKTFEQARNSIRPNAALVHAIKTFKARCQGSTKIFAMSNISKEDWDLIASGVNEWNIFDRVFTSAGAGRRKPDSSFYTYVLDAIGTSALEVIFVDDKLENVFAAQTLGIRAYVFNEKYVIELLGLIESNPVEQGYRYLLNSSCCLESITESGVIVHENFARLLIQDALPLTDLVELQWKEKRTWNFFIGDPVLIPGNTFPDDLDTTALALRVVPPQSDQEISFVLNEMLKYEQSDGNFQTYFCKTKRRTDIIVSANVLACFYHYGRGHELPNTLQAVREALLQRAYIDGTHYYANADCCLYFFGHLLRSSDDKHLHNAIGSLLKDRLQERVGYPASALELAMRIITCCFLDIPCLQDMTSLLELQQDDGSWPVGWIYRYGSTGMMIGNKGLTTAMAIKAISSQ